MSLTPTYRLDPVRQLSLFGTEAADPSLADLAGLLAGPGEVVRMGGTARLSVVVTPPGGCTCWSPSWPRAGCAASWEPTEDGRHLVRTSYASTLAPLALAWLRGAVKRPPAGFHLNGRRLRLWLAAAGAADPAGFLLRLGAGGRVVLAAGAGGAGRGRPARGAARPGGGRAGVPDHRPTAAGPAGRAGG